MPIDRGSVGINGGGGVEFSELFNKRVSCNFFNFLIKAGGIVEIPKQGVGHRSENFE